MDTKKQTILFRLEQDISNLLCDKLESAEITLERASLIARFILAHLPPDLPDEKLEKILPMLDDEFIELAGVVHKYMNEYEEKYKEKLTNDVQALIKSGRMDEASMLMKAYFNKRLL